MTPPLLYVQWRTQIWSLSDLPSVLHPYALMSRVTCIRHMENNIYQGCCLGNLPMDASALRFLRGDSVFCIGMVQFLSRNNSPSNIDDEVSYRTMACLGRMNITAWNWKSKNIQITGCLKVLITTGKIWVRIWVIQHWVSNWGSKVNSTRHPPITANPSKLAEAKRVGGFLASPISWE